MTASPSKPTKASIELALVFTQYGRLMLSVQRFEMLLATLVLTLEVDPDKPVTNPRRHFGRLLKRMIHAYRRATPSEMRNRLQGKIDDDLLEAVSNSIKWRDRLAHSYLRDGLRMEPDQAFKRGALPEMTRLTQGFDRLGTKLQEETLRVLEMMRDDRATPPLKVQEAIADVAASMMLGRELPTAEPRREGRGAEQ